MFLEKQIQNVDGIVSGFEQQLAKDGSIPDQPDALQTRSQQLKVSGNQNHAARRHRAEPAPNPPSLLIKQALRKDAASQKAELNKLGKELDLTQQACSSLQRSFNEYCPDVCRQENQVKRLRSRYSGVDLQVQDR